MKKIISLICACMAFNIVLAQNIDNEWLDAHYNKSENMVAMRDGTKLCTIVYSPKDSSETHPILMLRSPYSISPYGEKGWAGALTDEWSFYVEKGYIIVYQNVRGRQHSEGEFMLVRPFIENKKPGDFDEASDTYDTIDWLLANTHNNGNVGVIGGSYSGYHANLAALCGHPALKAVCPQAPLMDWYREDSHNNGVFKLLETYFYGGGFYRMFPQPAHKIPSAKLDIDKDAYSWFLEKKTIENVTSTFADPLPFWNEQMEHPDYDGWWKERALGPHMKNIRPAVLVVGATYDTDNTYGALVTYNSIKNNSPETPLYFSYGPWYHCGWNNTDYYRLGDIEFRKGMSTEYRENIEFPFFEHYLREAGDAPAHKVNILVSGTNEWEYYDEWTPAEVEFKPLYLAEGGSLSWKKPRARKAQTSYISDPENPVPHWGKGGKKKNKAYMVADQRYSEGRRDVLRFEMPLEDSLKLEGPIHVELYASATTEDADFVVRLVDVLPDGYQMLVRGEICRARYRGNNFSSPKKLTPGKVTKIGFDMNDVAHCFLPGHKLMVIVQSSAFPLYDLNPQKWVDNIYHARPEDFIPAEITICHQRSAASRLILPIMH